MIIYTAILSVLFLGRQLNNQHITGLLLATFGLTVVGLSAYLDTERATTSMFRWSYGLNSSQVVFGIGLTVFSQLCSAVQVVVEESLLKSSYAQSYQPPSPARVVAFEGLCGLAVMAVVLVCMQFIPGDDHGSFENSIDSMEKLVNNFGLSVLVLIYCLSIALFNQFGMSVSKYLSSLHRTLIDSLRALVVWGAQLILYYACGLTAYGTEWNSYSFVQLFGFLLLVLGTLVYNEVIMLFKIPGPESEVEEPMMSEQEFNS
jgi:drug/metabolite transporter (DMT)-like permease